MTQPPGDSPTEHGRPRPRRALLLVLVGATATYWLSCSVQKHYEVLSFFFDGVPDPNAPMVGSGPRAARAAGLTYFAHQPYVENACHECHEDPSNVFGGRSDSSVCLKCHTDVVQQYPVMHGPVAAVACLYCHKPHESTLPNLLRSEAPQLCRQCHVPGLLGAPQRPDHVQMEEACLDCHFGHGGRQRYFLRNTSQVEEAGGEPNEPAVEGDS